MHGQQNSKFHSRKGHKSADLE